MSEGRRPGGLTALAVLNLVFGACDVLGAGGCALQIAVVNGAVDLGKKAEPDIEKMIALWERLGTDLLYLVTASYAVCAVLLIVSGIGYLKQHRFWGRTVGNLYALASIGFVIATPFVVKDGAERGFDLSMLVNVVYPLLTLVLLNTTF